MMKKIIAMLLTLSMVLTSCAALAAVEVPALKAVTEEYLKGEDYMYEYDEEYECFDLSFSLDCALDTADVTIFLYDDMLIVDVDCPLDVPEDKFEQMAIFATLVNSESYYAHFVLDPNLGLTCRASNVIETVMPGAEEIDTLLSAPVYYMEIYGDAITAIISANVDPYTAFTEYVQE